MKKIVFDSRGPSGNIFFVLGQASAAIGEEKGKEMIERAVKQTSYDGALAVVREYVKLVDKSGLY